MLFSQKTEIAREGAKPQRKSSSFHHKEHKGHKKRNLQMHHSESCLTRRVNHISTRFNKYPPFFEFLELFAVEFICL
ncbi:MAG: hypothetical protein D4R65_15170 [Verrucomicrobiaceae bacterium]|nr:MAG: hypothetical protein D4R65_15170 [Verrucomicrobiaceae bacterium]